MGLQFICLMPPYANVTYSSAEPIYPSYASGICFCGVRMSPHVEKCVHSLLHTFCNDCGFAVFLSRVVSALTTDFYFTDGAHKYRNANARNTCSWKRGFGSRKYWGEVDINWNVNCPLRNRTHNTNIICSLISFWVMFHKNDWRWICGLCSTVESGYAD